MYVSVHSLLLTLSYSLIFLMFPSAPIAQEKNFREIFDEIVLERPRFAVSASYTLGADEAVVMTAGPIVKGGSIATAKDARWHIGSISKSFTSTLIMRLVERGKLALDEPVGRYLPTYRENMHPDWKMPTLRQLLSHTAGLPANAPRQITQKTYNDHPYKARRDVLSAMWDKPLGGGLGNFAYSNIGYVLAGVVIEEVTGITWEEAIMSEVAEPLGLSSLGFGAPQGARDPRGHKSVLGYKSPVAPEDAFSDNPRWMGPAGTIHLSMDDLTRWGQIHISTCNGRRPNYLTQASCQEMQSPVSDDYGLGWVIQKSETSGNVVWHNGSNTMWYALLYMIPDKDMAVAVATNVYAPRRLDRLARDLSIALMNGRL